MTTAVPTTINLGSGKQFMADCLNIDIQPRWNPDLLCDLSKDLANNRTFISERFGPVQLLPNSIDRIMAYDVLEHVPDLVSLMGNCLELFKVGGEFDIKVPYDLSYGAWQDPTHIRAFNERSWLYYTDWHWYLGWTESRFDTTLLEMELSDLGRQLMEDGRQLGEIMHVPRAIDSMHVILKKRLLSHDEQQFALQYFSRDKGE